MALVNRQQVLNKTMDPQNSVRGSLNVSSSVEVIEGPAGGTVRARLDRWRRQLAADGDRDHTFGIKRHQRVTLDFDPAIE